MPRRLSDCAQHNDDQDTDQKDSDNDHWVLNELHDKEDGDVTTPEKRF
jgi:hypothetical protein